MKATYVARHHWPKLLAGSSPPVWARLSFTVLPHPSGTAPRLARSALTLRLILASFGLLACTAGAVVFLTAVIQSAVAAAWSFFAAAALADVVVVARRKLRGEPG